MSKAWAASALSLATIAGGHFYNRRPYTAVFFLFLLFVAPLFVDNLLPLFQPLDETPQAERWYFRMIWVKGALVLVIAAASAICAFRQARASSAAEGEDLKMIAVITGALIGFGTVVMAAKGIITMIRFYM